MIKETVAMSYKEFGRLQVIQESVKRHITQEQAALRIGVSVRQVKRVVHQYRDDGPAGLISRRRGKRPNNALISVLGCIVDIIIFSFTHTNYGDCHNFIIDTVNQSVTRATELYFVLVFTSVEL